MAPNADPGRTASGRLRGATAACSACGATLRSAVVCEACGRIVPQNPCAGAVDAFDVLGVPRKFGVDPAELHRRLVELSRVLHPDFFRDRAPAEREASQRLSAAVNEAYATLRDPVRRAEHVVRLLGGKSAEGDKRTPPGFLEETLELREELEEARASGDRAAQERVARALEARREAALGRVAERLERALAQGDSAAQRAEVDAVRLELNVDRYARNLLREIVEREEAEV